MLLKELNLKLLGIHHAAIISSDYARSKHFYSNVLKLNVINEHFRADRNSYKLDLAMPDGSQIELFSFYGAPTRPSYPEAQGLRHLAFKVADIQISKTYLESCNVDVEDIRVDEITGKKFTFFADPDNLPLELYEV